MNNLFILAMLVLVLGACVYLLYSLAIKNDKKDYISDEDAFIKWL